MAAVLSRCTRVQHAEEGMSLYPRIPTPHVHACTWIPLPQSRPPPHSPHPPLCAPPHLQRPSGVQVVYECFRSRSPACPVQCPAWLINMEGRTGHSSTSQHTHLTLDYLYYFVQISELLNRLKCLITFFIWSKCRHKATFSMFLIL